jgi:hypothetical protein
LGSCEKDLENVNATTNVRGKLARISMESSHITESNNKIEIAKILAKAIHDENLRKFIKEESLKKFDGDYDVLFQLVKDKKIDNKTSIYSYLSSFAKSPDEFKLIIENLPLLAVYVPTFLSSNKWDTSVQIPIIAVRDKDDRLIAFNSEGESVELSPKEEPNIPILVVKISDKVVLEGPGNQKGNQSDKNNFIFNNGQHSFYFLDETLNNINPRNRAARKVSLLNTTFDPLVV